MELVDKISKIVYQLMCKHDFMELNHSSFSVCKKCGKIKNNE